MKKLGFFVLLVMATMLSTQNCRAGTMADFLAKTDCFQGLTQTELRAVAAVAGPGTTLGEMEFVDGQPASANVVVSIDAQIVEFDPASLRDLLQNQPSIGYQVMGNMARKISSQLRRQQ